MFYLLSAIVIVAKSINLAYLDPPYASLTTVVANNFANYSMMSIGLLQISNLLEIRARVAQLTREKTEMDRSFTEKFHRKHFLGILLALLAITFVIDTAFNVVVVWRDP